MDTDLLAKVVAVAGGVVSLILTIFGLLQGDKGKGGQVVAIGIVALLLTAAVYWVADRTRGKYLNVTGRLKKSPFRRRVIGLLVLIPVGALALMALILQRPAPWPASTSSQTAAVVVTTLPQPSQTAAPQPPLPTTTAVPTSAPLILSRLTDTPASGPKVTEASTIAPTPTPTSIPVTPLPAETLFRECRSHTFGNTFVSVAAGCYDRNQALQLAWITADKDSYAGCTIPLDSGALSAAANNTALVLWVRGGYDGELISIKLTDASGDHTRQLPLSTEWQQVPLVILNDFPDLDLHTLSQLVIGLDYDPGADLRQGKGSACFGSMGFGSP